MTSSDVEDRLDRLTTSVLIPLRTEKRVVTEDIDELCRLVATARDEGLFRGSIEVRLAGKFWSIFCSMLAEADHARDPDPILNAAWRYQEELRRSFGPVF
jgi:hypothetical protein